MTQEVLAADFSYADKCDKEPSFGISASCWERRYEYYNLQEHMKVLK